MGQLARFNPLGTFTVTLAVLLSAISVAVLFRAYATHGPFSPLTCSVFHYRCPEDVPFYGFVDDDYAAVADQFKAQFLNGQDIGGGVAAYVDNKLVLDVQGGWQDVDRKIPYTDKTLQIVFSSTKVLTAIVVAQMVEQGHLSYDEKVATYWPEFAQGNKENVTVADLLQHKAGLGFFNSPIDSAAAEDPDRFSRLLASQPHTFGGVPKRSYHAFSNGWYINEVLKRTSNTTVDAVAATYAEKYGVEWRLKPFQEEYDSRIAPLYMSNSGYQLYTMLGGGVKSVREIVRAIKDEGGIMSKTMATALDAVVSTRMTELRYRRIENPSNSGYTNARSIAKLAAMMANGGKAVVTGEPNLLDDATYALATRPEPQADFDLLINYPIHSLKGGFSTIDFHVIDNVTFIGWAGFGGSVFFWNPEQRIGFGYVSNAILNYQSPDERSLSMLAILVKLVKAKHSM